MKHLIIVMRDEAAWAIGPFDSDDAARDWALAHWDTKNGDPRWQALALPPTHLASIKQVGEGRLRDVVQLPLHDPGSAEAEI